MQFHYEEDFVEAAVFICTSGHRKGVPSLQIARFNREREKLYAVLDPDERNCAFFRLHLQWFCEWRLDELLSGPVQEFPLLSASLKILAFRKSRGRNDEGAELYVNEAGERHGTLSMRPERFDGGVELSSFLRHEFTHLNDMVDPVYGYVPALPGVSRSPGQYRLAIERYRVLWDVSIDGRLHQRRLQTISTREQRWLEFVSAFGFWSKARQQQVFNSLWSEPVVSHAQLLELVCDPRGLQSTSGPTLGAPCPLCGFPTFAWADPLALTDTMVDEIQREFPEWTPQAGTCARCLETFRVRRSQVPAVV